MTSSLGALRLLLVVVLMMSTTGKRFHSNSFISEESGLSYLYQSFSVMMEDPLRALYLFLKAYQFKPTNHLLEVALHIHDLLGNANIGISWAIEESSRNEQYLLYKDFLAATVALYQAEKNNEAMSLLNPWVAKNPCAVEALYHLALIHQRRGHTDGARLLYEQVLRCNPLHTSSMVNVASLYQLSGSQVDRQKAIIIYETGISAILAYKKVLPGFLFLSDNELRMRANLALAYYQQFSFQKALEASQDMINLLHNSIGTINAIKSHMDVSTYVALLDGAYGNQLIISRAVVNWKGAEERLHRILTSTLNKYSSFNSSSKMTKQTGSMVVGPYLPFDSLLDDVTLADRLSIATYTSLMFLKIQSTTTERMDTALQVQAPSKSLHIALYSTDFCDHPTTHLMLGLYLYLHRQKQRQPSTWYHNIQLIVYDYGGHDDQSDYRKRVQEFADRYVSVRDVDHDAFLDIVRHDAIDVFLEMQVHTLQTRLHVTALVADAVPSVSSFVNYLVYPGTSGSSALDHIVGDPVVLPPEHAAWYSEKFCLLPPTYQISSYDALGLVEVDDTKERFENSAENAHAASERWLADEIAGMPFFPRTVEDIHQLQTLYRRKYGLPLDPEAIVFANFNKIDKLDPESLSTWAQILHLLPNSYLWLLLPHEANESDHHQLVLAHLQAACAYWGITWTQRIIVAERAPKRLHIERHIAADLFLDSFIYGAHSTATDSLRGGLPVVTIEGGSFPNRVGASLHASMSSSLFVTYSKKDFIDFVVRIGRLHTRYPSVLLGQKLQLFQAMAKKAMPFDEGEHARRLLVALSALKEEKRLVALCDSHVPVKRQCQFHGDRRRRWHLVLRSTA